MAQAGYDVSLVICAEQDHVVEGVKIRALPKWRSRLERVSVTAFRAIRHAWREDAAIYHFHDPELVLWAWILRLRKARVVFDVHENVIGSLNDKVWIPVWARSVLRGIAALTLRFTMKAYDVVFAESSYPSDYPWVKNYQVICNYPQPDHFPQIEEFEKFQDPTVVYVGSISITRGALDLLDAMVLVQDRISNAALQFIGRADLPEGMTLDHEIARRGLSNIEIPGYMPQPEALKLVSKSHVGVAMLHPVANYLRSYPTKIFEYMGCGIPVITSDFRLYKEIVVEHECGICCEPRQPQKLADALISLLEDKTERTRLGKNGQRSVAEKFNWRSQETRLLELYASLVQS